MIRMLRTLIAYALRTALSGVALVGLNFIGIDMGINPINAAIMGCLGIPGICSAVAVNFIL